MKTLFAVIGIIAMIVLTIIAIDGLYWELAFPLVMDINKVYLFSALLGYMFVSIICGIALRKKKMGGGVVASLCFLVTPIIGLLIVMAYEMNPSK